MALPIFPTVSLVLNIVVLVPVCFGLLSDASWAGHAYGAGTDARAILLAVYLAILVVSVLLLLRPNPAMIAALLLVQVLYKAMTPFTVGGLDNPVVVSNLAITAVHGVSLVLIWRSGALSPTRQKP